MHWNRMLLVGSLALTLSGCGALATTSSGSRDAKLVLPACPPDQMTLEFGWIGPRPASLPDGRALQVFAMTSDDVDTLNRWMDGWRRCAHGRGIVIEEANR